MLQILKDAFKRDALSGRRVSHVEKTIYLGTASQLTPWQNGKPIFKGCSQYQKYSSQQCQFRLTSGMPERFASFDIKEDEQG